LISRYPLETCRKLGLVRIHEMFRIDFFAFLLCVNVFIRGLLVCVNLLCFRFSVRAINSAVGFRGIMLECRFRIFLCEALVARLPFLLAGLP
jgi:hypothetical protein